MYKTTGEYKETSSHKWARPPKNRFLFWFWRGLFVFGGAIFSSIGICLLYGISSENLQHLLLFALVYVFWKILCKFEQWVVNNHKE